MNGFVALFRNDLTLLFRQKVLLVIAISTAIYIALVLLIPAEQSGLWLPAILFTEVITMGVLFIAGTVFLEKTQGTVLALCVTPMSTSSWILSKTFVFTIISTLAGCLLVIINNAEVNYTQMFIAVFFSALLYNQIGFIIAATSRDISHYFLPLAITMGISGISIYWHFGFLSTPLLWLLPSHPAMILLAGIQHGSPLYDFLISLVILLMWNLMAYKLCLSVFNRTISQRIGL